MKRYRAVLAQGVSVDDAKLEIEACNGGDLEVAGDQRSVTFIADVDDIPAISAMSSVESVHETQDQAQESQSRGRYVGLTRTG